MSVGIYTPDPAPAKATKRG